jgi:hypothetical protein
LIPQEEALAPPRHRRDLGLNRFGFDTSKFGLKLPDLNFKLPDFVQSILEHDVVQSILEHDVVQSIVDKVLDAVDGIHSTGSGSGSGSGSWSGSGSGSWSGSGSGSWSGSTDTTTTTATATTVTTVPNPNCGASNNRKIQCLNTLGPNGGAGACKYKNKLKKCVDNTQFVDLAIGSEPEPEPVELADCGGLTTSQSDCLLISGPNGGAGACRYNTQKKRCVNRGTFVDNPPPVLTDCSAGDFKAAVCQAILGPNGGANACKFKLNPNKENYRKCVNNNNFVDL